MDQLDKHKKNSLRNAIKTKNNKLYSIIKKMSQMASKVSSGTFYFMLFENIFFYQMNSHDYM